MTEDPIPPDTKDWTWVVAQPCPECGLDTTTLDVSSAAATIEATTEAWERVLARDDVRTRPRPDRWSPLEYACHVRDVLRVCTGRLRSMRAEHDPVFANWDQDATAVEDRYGEQDPGTVAGELREAATAAAATAPRSPSTPSSATSSTSRCTTCGTSASRSASPRTGVARPADARSGRVYRRRPVAPADLGGPPRRRTVPPVPGGPPCAPDVP